MNKKISTYLINLAKESFKDDENKTFFEAHKILRKEDNIIYIYIFIGAYKEGVMCDWSVGPLKIEYKDNEIINVNSGNEDRNIYNHYKSFIPEDLIETCLSEDVKEEFYQEQIKYYLNGENND